MVCAKLWRERRWSTRRPVPPRLRDAGPERERPAGPQGGQARVQRTFRLCCEPVRSVLRQGLRGAKREGRV